MNYCSNFETKSENYLSTVIKTGFDVRGSIGSKQANENDKQNSRDIVSNIFGEIMAESATALYKLQVANGNQSQQKI